MTSERADTRQLALPLGPGPLCAGCPLIEPCGASEQPEACQPMWGDRHAGGLNVLHPSNPITWEYFHEIDGAGFDGVQVTPQHIPDLPEFIHQLRPVRALRGCLTDSTYAVGPWKTIDRRRVMTSAEFRDIVGLQPQQRVGLVLFGRDDVLERMWVRRFSLASEIAKAGYNFCVAPSFSNYLGRPRPEYLYNAKRSLQFFALLQEAGVNAVPRIAWLIEPDVRRISKWANANRTLDFVALDLSSSSAKDWARELGHLEMFDALTGHRLSYFVHGPSCLNHCLDLYQLLGPIRVHISNSRAIARPAVATASWADRLATESSIPAAARRVHDAYQRDMASGLGTPAIRLETAHG